MPTSTSLNKLRRIFLSWPIITAAGLFALYLTVGFFALPAIVKWQVEKQVPAKLGHQISVGAVRFNPLNFRFELDDLALADSGGSPMASFRRLLIDFELRSVIDRAWTFGVASVEAPVVLFSIDKKGRHNFAALLERLRSEEEAGELPRFVVNRIALTNGRIEFRDHVLEEALVTRIEPLSIRIDNLSSLPATAAPYWLSAKTAAGAELSFSGGVALNPVAAKGTLALHGINLNTLVRGLSRLVAIDSSAGTLNFTAQYHIAVDRDGTLSGSAQDVDLELAALSVTAAGADAPLVAIETLALQKGRVDLDKQVATFAGFRLAKGHVAVAVGEDGATDWAKLVRKSAPPEKAAATPPASATPPRVARDPKPWRVSVTRAEIADIAVRFSDALSGRTANVAALGFTSSPSAEFGPAGTRLELDKPRMTIADVRVESASESLGMPSAVVEAGRIAVVAADRGIELALDAPRVTAPGGVSAKQGGAVLELTGLTVQSGRIALESAAAIGGTVDAPKIALAGMSIKRAAESAQLGNVTLEGQRLTLQAGSGRFDLGIDKLLSTLADLRMRRGADDLDLRRITIAGERVSLGQTDAGIKAVMGTTAIAMSGLAARQASDRIAVKDGSFEAKAVSASTGGGSPGKSRVDARIDDAALKLVAVGIAQGAKSELARVSAANVGAKSLVLAVADGPVDVTGNGLSAALSNLIVRNPADATELLRVGKGTLSGGVLNLKDRVVSADKVALADGKARTGFDANGRFNWMTLFGTAGSDAGVAKPSRSAGRAAPNAAWRLSAKSAALDGFEVDFEDRRRSPALAVGLEAIRARLTGVDTGSATPMQVELKAAVAGGGDIQASGAVRADNGMSDLKVSTSGVVLAPVQPYLSEVAELKLASGTVSSDGRLRYGHAAGADAKLVYEGSFAVDRVALEEVDPQRPFFAWDSVSSGDMVVTLEPNRVDIGEVRLDGPSGRLIIAEDQSVNLMDVWKRKPREDTGASDDKPDNVKAASAEQTGTGGDPFPVTIARVRVSGGALDFADLSLRPQFGIRMHELEGVITGLGTDANSTAKVQLDARVDKFGSAKIRGQISVRRPEQLTEIDMTFRNVDMATLSPYVAKFAGYRITGGRLALDLQYKVLDKKLLGENKIVLRQMELGEKVEGPHALDLPLELAIAILKDSDGVIDIALPVRGNLDDPQFDYAAVIGKAIGNLLGSIITAPFRALGALFGGGDEKKLGTIDFEPGSDALAPPERQKLEAVARALKERPKLMLVVPPTYAVGNDAPALKSLAVRSDIVRHMGVELKPGEDPGPIDTANPRVQRGVEGALSQRLAPSVIAVLKRRAIESAAPAVESPDRAGASVQPSEGARGATGASGATGTSPGPSPAFYRSLVDRMIAEEPLPEQALAQLATRRGEAIVRELTAVGGVSAARVTSGELQKATDGSDKAVPLRLELEVAK